MQRQAHFDSLRGLAAALVVVSHSLNAFYPSVAFGEKYPTHAAWEKLGTTTPLGLLVAGPFAVSLFFLLSGYVLSLPYFGPGARCDGDLLAAMVKRPVRLGGLVVVSECVAFLLQRQSWFFNGEASRVSRSVPWLESFWATPMKLSQLVQDLMARPFAAGTNYNPPLWSISIELYGSLLTYLFLLFFRQSRWRVAAYVFAFFFFSYDFHQIFFLGILMADLAKNRPKWLEKPEGAWSGTLLALGLVAGAYPRFIDAPAKSGTMYGGWPDLPHLAAGYSTIGAMLVFLAVMLSPTLQRLLACPPLLFLGRISYALYALHFLVLGSFSCWLFLRLAPHFSYGGSVLLTAGISMPVLLLVSMLGTFWVDEKAIRLANRVADGWRRSLALAASGT